MFEDENEFTLFAETYLEKFPDAVEDEVERAFWRMLREAEPIPHQPSVYEFNGA